MVAVRCAGQTRGFRVDGEMFNFARWTLKTDEEITKNILEEPMLQVIEVDGPEDPRLAPYPVVDTEGIERETTVNLLDLKQALDVRDQKIEALQRQLAEAEAQGGQHGQQIESLQAELAVAQAESGQHQERIATLEGQIAAMEGHLKEVQTAVATFPEETSAASAGQSAAVAESESATH